MSTQYSAITDNLIKELESVVGAENVLVDLTDRILYARDRAITKYSEHFKKVPEVVVLPTTTEEVSKIAKIANREIIPITPYGGGTGFSGNAVPSHGGITIDMKRMNKIIEIDEDNTIVTAQAGIILEDLDKELRKYGLFLADDPVSFPCATLGGRISTHGDSYLMGRYGVISNLVTGMEVVIPTGEVMRFGGGGGYKIAKSSVGYPLRHLFFGAMGTLGIITEAALIAYPIPEETFHGLFAFDEIDSAFKAANRLIKTGIKFSMLSVSDKYRSLLAKNLDPETVVAEWNLSLRLEGLKEEVDALKRKIRKICEEEGGRDLGEEVAKSDFEFRHEFDTALPAIAQMFGTGAATWQVEEFGILPTESKRLLKHFIDILKKHGIRNDEITINCQWQFFPYQSQYTGYMINEKAEEKWDTIMGISEEMADAVLKVGGTVSNAHGLGIRRLNKYVQRELGPTFKLMMKIKKIFDPNNIMNPGKMGLEAAYKEA